MKKPYIEGLATHDDPESCTVGRKDGGEALTGVHTGGPLSREIKTSGMPTQSRDAEGDTGVRRSRGAHGQSDRRCGDNNTAQG